MQVRVAQSLGEQAVAEAVSGAGYPLTLDQYRGFEQGSMLPKRWHDFMTAYLQAMGLQPVPPAEAQDEQWASKIAADDPGLLVSQAAAYAQLAESLGHDEAGRIVAVTPEQLRRSLWRGEPDACDE